MIEPFETMQAAGDFLAACLADGAAATVLVWNHHSTLDGPLAVAASRPVGGAVVWRYVWPTVAMLMVKSGDRTAAFSGFGPLAGRSILARSPTPYCWPTVAAVRHFIFPHPGERWGRQ